MHSPSPSNEHGVAEPSQDAFGAPPVPAPPVALPPAFEMPPEPPGETPPLDGAPETGNPPLFEMPPDAGKPPVPVAPPAPGANAASGTVSLPPGGPVIGALPGSSLPQATIEQARRTADVRRR